MTQPSFAPEFIADFNPPLRESVVLQDPMQVIGEDTTSTIGSIALDEFPQPNVEAIEWIFGNPASIPVPLRYEFHNKLPFVFAPTSRYVCATDVAQGLQMSLATLSETITELNVPYYMLVFDKVEGLLLAPGLKKVISEEIAWRGRYNEAESLVDTSQLAELIGGDSNEQKLTATMLMPLIRKNKLGHTEGPEGERLYPKAIAHQLRADVMLAAQKLSDPSIQRGPQASLRDRVDMSLLPDNFNSVLVADMLRVATMRPGIGIERTDGVLPFSDVVLAAGTTEFVAKTVLGKLGIEPMHVSRIPHGNKLGRGIPAYTVDVLVPLERGIIDHWTARIAELEKSLEELAPSRVTGAPKLLLRQYNALQCLLTKARGKHSAATETLERLLSPDEAIAESKAS